jgi:hypothetical protein
MLEKPPQPHVASGPRISSAERTLNNAQNTKAEIHTMSAGAAAAGGGAGAAAEQQRQQAEEEEMTPYTHKDLTEDWEFKILRSLSNAFRKPERLAEILEEEGKAGWILVEKFDNRRIRLKRRAKCRKDDRTLDFDSYRSYVGSSEGAVAAIVAGVCVAVGLAVFLIVQLLA